MHQNTTVGRAALALGLLTCGCESAGAESEESLAKVPALTEGQAQEKAAAGEAEEATDPYGPARVLIDPGAEVPRPVAHAVAVMRPTEGNHAHGTVRLEVAGEQELEVTLDLERLPPGKHAAHFHLYGDCSGPDGKSAGTHFNLQGSSDPVPPGTERITGNITEVEVGEDGRADATFTLKGASLDGRFGVLGRSVIVHAKGNDPSSPPMGAAGARLACGTIGLADATLSGS